MFISTRFAPCSKKINYSNLFINYRNVNQSEKWKRQRIKIKDKKLYTKISNGTTGSASDGDPGPYKEHESNSHEYAAHK